MIENWSKFDDEDDFNFARMEFDKAESIIAFSYRSFLVKNAEEFKYLIEHYQDTHFKNKDFVSREFDNYFLKKYKPYSSREFVNLPWKPLIGLMVKTDHAIFYSSYILKDHVIQNVSSPFDLSDSYLMNRDHIELSNFEGVYTKKGHYIGDMSKIFETFHSNKFSLENVIDFLNLDVKNYFDIF